MRLFFIVAAVCTLGSCNSLPDHRDFAVGMTRTDVLERFGEPSRSSNMRKADNAVWGPIEDFWSRIPVGGTVEIWFYRTTHESAAGSGNRKTGTTEIYFVDGSPTVSGRGFAPDGVVY